MGKIIAVLNQKGGVGKTTTAINIGAALNAINKKVLIVDADPQGHMTIGLGLSKTDMQHTLENLLRYVVMDAGAIEPAQFIQKSAEGMDALTSNKMLAGMESLLDNSGVLARALAPFKEVYDDIIIDCMPSLGILNINVLYAADSLLIPMVAEYYSADGLVELLSTLYRVNQNKGKTVEVEGILYNKDKSRLKNNRDIKKSVEDICEAMPIFGVKPFDMEIPDYVCLTEAAKSGKSIMAYNNSRCQEQINGVRKIYLELAKQIGGGSDE